MQFYDEKTVFFSDDGVTFSWRISPEGTDVSSLTSKIFRSESPTKGFIEIGTVNLVTEFSYFDPIHWQSPHRRIFYKIIAYSSGSAVASSLVIAQESYPDKLSIEISRQYDILLKGVNGHKPYVGMKSTLYKRNNISSRCIDCFDEITRQIILSDCTRCNGTGKVDGYYDPVDLYIGMQPVDKSSGLGAVETQPMAAQFWTSSFPIVSIRDIIVEYNETHWVVDAIEISERQRHVIHQVITVSNLHRGAIEYGLHHIDN